MVVLARIRVTNQCIRERPHHGDQAFPNRLVGFGGAVGHDLGANPRFIGESSAADPYQDDPQQTATHRLVLKAPVTILASNPGTWAWCRASKYRVMPR